MSAKSVLGAAVVLFWASGINAGQVHIITDPLTGRSTIDAASKSLLQSIVQTANTCDFPLDPNLPNAIQQAVESSSPGLPVGPVPPVGAGGLPIPPAGDAGGAPVVPDTGAESSGGETANADGAAAEGGSEASEEASGEDTPTTDPAAVTATIAGLVSSCKGCHDGSATPGKGPNLITKYGSIEAAIKMKPAKAAQMAQVKLGLQPTSAEVKAIAEFAKIK